MNCDYVETLLIRDIGMEIWAECSLAILPPQILR
jgi:hypothetical protein